MARYFLHFRLILMKHFTLMKRSPITTMVEILVPFILYCLVCIEDPGKEASDPSSPYSGYIHPAWLNRTVRVKKKLLETVYYSPTSTVTENMFDDAKEFVNATASSSYDEVVERLQLKGKVNSGDDENLPSGVVFTTLGEQSQKLPHKIAYTIILLKRSATTDFVTGRAFYEMRVHFEDDTGYRSGNYSKFLRVQQLIDKAISMRVAKENNKEARFNNLYQAIDDVGIKSFPHRNVTMSGKCEMPILGGPFFLHYLCFIGYVFLVPSVIHSLIQEKESKVREVLKMMGVRNWILWTTWFTRLFVVQFVIVSLATMLLTVPFADSFHRFKYSDPGLIFLFLLMYGISTVCFCFCISVFFSSANIGAIFGFLFFCCTVFLPLVVKQNYGLSVFCSLLNNVPMVLGFKVILIYEQRLLGVTWDNLHLPPDSDERNSLTFSTVLLMMLVDSCLYCLITWYVDAVFPGEYGVPHKWYFPCQPSYWCKIRPASIDQESEKGRETSDYFEEEPSHLKVGVCAQNIRKVFSSFGTETVAVADVSINAYAGQVTTLLGHNGAGKTTFLSVITGFITSSGGEAYVNGHSINNDIDSVRESLGICPQYDILFQDLTVEEHMTLFAGLKGCSSKDIKPEVEKWLKEVGLEFKRKTRAKALSGGMKRKLSLACCLIGDSQVVILDEPSSGVDPTARSQIWDILKRNKENRTVVLTTHYMEEADKLSDRIAIMAEGRIRCCGSPLFLKGKYGTGYHLAIVKLPGYSAEPITEVIKKHVPTAIISTSGDLYYTLPKESRPEFMNLFKELEGAKASLGIDSFGVSVTTLEDVFIKVGEGIATETITSDTYSETRTIECTTQDVNNAESNEDIEETTVLPGVETDVDTWTEGVETDIDTWTDLDSRTDETLSKNNSNKNKHPSNKATRSTVEDENVDTGGSSIIYPSMKINTYDSPKSTKPRNSKSSVGSENQETKVLKKGAGVNNNAPLTDSRTTMSFITIKSPQLELQQFGALTVKRIIGLSGSKLYLSMQVVFPLLVTGLVIVFLSGVPAASIQDGRERTYLYAETFPRSIISSGVMTNGTQSSADLSMATAVQEHYEALYKGKNGITTVDVSKYANTIVYVNDYFKNKYVEFSNKFIIAMVIEIVEGAKMRITAFYNKMAHHGAPQTVNALSNALLHYVVDDDSYNIETTLHPFYVDRQHNTRQQSDMKFDMMNTFTVNIVVCSVVSILCMSFAVFPIRERVTMFKQIQLLSGHRLCLFWLNYFVIDLIFYATYVAFLTMLICVTDKHDLGKDPGAIFFILLMYGWTGIPLAYLISFVIRSSLHAVLRTTIIFIPLIYCGLVVSSEQSSTFTTNPEGARASSGGTYELYGRALFGLFPLMNIGESLYRQKTNFINWESCSSLLETCSSVPDYSSPSFYTHFLRMKTETDPYKSSRPCCGLSKCEPSNACRRFEENALSFTEPGIGVNMLVLFLHGCIYMLLVYAIDAKVPGRIMKALTKELLVQPTITDTEDSDVHTERERARNEPSRDEIVLVRDLTKTYGSFKAVNGLAFVVTRGECFGLLGVNGAGKTTSFRMITGQEQPSGGLIYLQNEKGLKNARRSLGFCPQFDGLLEELTVKETLKFFARTRGMPEVDVINAVTELASELMLTEHMAKRIGRLSGGNKRKVSTAVAVIGDPEIIILDEPTCGIDPMARRELWNVLERLRLRGCTLILTSHNMEECEALCSRVGIMVNGTLKCIGTTQHLKSKFSEGCTVTARIAKHEDVDYVTPFTKHLQEQFPNGSLKEKEQNIVIFMIHGENVSWANVFKLMEDATIPYHIEDYSVSQTTLEQVFNNFARAQAPDELSTEKSRGCCKKKQ